MSEQTLHTLFYFVFLSQVVLISYVFPQKILARVRHVFETYPPSSHPRLYGSSVAAAERAQRVYKNLNAAIFAVGLTLGLYGVFFLSNGPLRDIGAVSDFTSYEFMLAMFLLIQFAPLPIAVLMGFPYFSFKRKADTRTVRTAQLKPRRFLDLVSPVLLGTAIAVYVGFIGFVTYVRQFEFSWFGGYTNVAIVTAVNLGFLAMVMKQIYGKKKDPYQSHEDRERQIELTLRTTLLVSIALTLFVALTVTLRAVGWEDLSPIKTSLYFQLLALLSMRDMRIDHVNFDVYREDPVAA